MSQGRWTVEDLAVLTQLALDQNGHRLCEHCNVVPVSGYTSAVTSERYCDGCVEMIATWLYACEMDRQAELAKEDVNTEKGLY